MAAVSRGVDQVVAVPLATAGVAGVEMTPEVAVVSYKVHESASDDTQAIEVVVLYPMVCEPVSDVIAGDAATVAAGVAVGVGVRATVEVEVVEPPPPPPPHETIPESTSNKTKYAPTKRGVA